MLFFLGSSSIPYLAWKTDGNDVDQPSVIWIRRVEEDGFTFDEASPQVEIMRADEPSDVLVAEGQGTGKPHLAT